MAALSNQLPLKLTGTPIVPTQFVAGTDTVGPTTGGTGLAAFANQSILVASAVNTWTNLAVGSSGQFLGVVAGAVTWTSVPAQSQLALSLTNIQGSTVKIGQPVFLSAANDVKLAQANNNQTTAIVIGQVADVSIANNTAGNIALAGVLTATTGQWDAIVTGESGGLTAGNIYYASAAVAGNLANNTPDQTNSGNFAVVCGEGLNTTQMRLSDSYQMFGY